MYVKKICELMYVLKIFKKHAVDKTALLQLVVTAI
jgi:hypothetical protein